MHYLGGMGTSVGSEGPTMKIKRYVDKSFFF
jgi:hypothetical protein